MGIDCFRVRVPEGHGRQRIRAEGDASGEEPGRAAEYARQWLGKGQRPAAAEPVEPSTVDRATASRQQKSSS